MDRASRRIATLVALATLIVLTGARPSIAYSVLAHESNVDALWDASIEPLLRQKFPGATAADLATARAYCYGGSVIQDLGYYPFGSPFFSDLLHYARSGDFVAIMLQEARTLDEYAFAVGALAHYFADNTGHPDATNRAVAIMFPKLRKKYGESVPYATSPGHHKVVEFSFDVVQAAGGGYESDAYHRFIGFEVAKPLLERAFKATYGLDMRDVFLFDEDLAIGTYRRALSQLIPKATEIAWRDQRAAIERITPGVTERVFVLKLSRAQYDEEFGAIYKRPPFATRLLLFVYRLIPKFGLLRPLRFEAPTLEAEALFQESLRNTRRKLGDGLTALPGGAFTLTNTDFDTGQPSAYGEYSLADRTYARLLLALHERGFATASHALRRHLVRYYGLTPPAFKSAFERRRIAYLNRALAALRELPGSEP